MASSSTIVETVLPAPGAVPEAQQVSKIVLSKPQAPLLKRIVSVPAFFSFLAYLQTISAAGIVAMIFGWKLSHATVAQHLLGLLRTRFAHSAKSKTIMDDTHHPVVFLCNHRSWGDFWIDAAILGGTSFVSRWAVAPAIPITAVWGWLQGWMWLFNRNAKRHSGWVSWLSNFFMYSRTMFPMKGLVLYPEGTRSHLPKGNPLKTKSLEAIYKLGWPVQVVISTNKENLMNEGKCWVGIGETINTAVSEAIWPNQVTTCEEFLEKIKATWSSTWDEAYSSMATEGGMVLRESTQLPGAALVPRTHLNPRIRKARFVVAMMTALYMLYRWYRNRNKADASESTE
mmetsp:Transcript_52436/g.111739  ORF Transcript_52436/g.111739 Transcript_52436/m.111739 type:complete len:342 (+) Transcript_52436:190-1215(+)